MALNSKNKKSINLVVITGGEPMRQLIELLCQKLLDQGFKVQIEINGTLYRSLPNEVSIICSPKAGKNGYSKIREDLLLKISAVKFIVAKNILEYNFIPEVGQTSYNIPIFIQPMDQNNQRLNDENNELAVKLALESGASIVLKIDCTSNLVPSPLNMLLLGFCPNIFSINYVFSISIIANSFKK